MNITANKYVAVTYDLNVGCPLSVLHEALTRLKQAVDQK